MLRYRAVSDRTGRFELGPVIAGQYQVGVWASGFLPLASQELSLPLLSMPLRIELSRGATLEGLVNDKGGYPLAGARVSVIYRDPDKGPASNQPIGELGVVPGPVPKIPPEDLADRPELSVPVASATTDEHGRYRLTGLQPGELRVEAEHPDYASSRGRWIKVTGAEVRQLPPLTLRRATRLRGRILDRRGIGLAGAQVAALAGDISRLVLTGSSGEFVMRGLTGRVTVTASASGYLPRSKRLRLAGAERELDLVLEPARELVSGYVLDPRRLPVAGARVVARQGRHRVRGRCDHTGFFELKGVGRGSVELEVSHGGYLPVRLTSRPGRELEIRLAYQAAVAGRVQEHRTGTPVTRFSLRIAGRKGTELVSDPQGRFRLKQLAPGRLTLWVQAPAFSSVQRTITVPRPRQPGELTRDGLVITLHPAGTITGRVSDLITGRAIAGARVSTAGVQAASGKDGRFRLERVPEGQHRVRVKIGVREVFSDPVSVRPGEVAGPLRLELK
jgi:hypothetical protein